MPKFPEPPGALAAAADVKVLPARTRLWRIYFAGGAYPATWNGFRFFGPTNSRFDHHEEPARLQARGILYAAAIPLTCLAEVFQVTRVIDQVNGAPWLVGFDLVRVVHLLDLTGAWPTRAGASMAINTGPRPRAQRWSKLIYATYPNVEGIYYPSSMHGNQPSIAFFERAQGAMPNAPIFNRALSDPALALRLGTAAAKLRYRIV
ncbi:MAG TPA: RES family NAD+ phosphorylase [Polyangiaceae bacterium]|nr:RES family NAD+ phosphorylase [Polyangiaceae bacterium]